MFMRFLQLKINPEFQEMFKGFYDKMVLPELQKMPGCLFAGLIQNMPHPQEFISLTLWESQLSAENYEKSEVFKKLNDRIKPFLSESAEWKIQLSEDLEVQYAPEPEEPILKEFSVAAQIESEHVHRDGADCMYVRIFSAHIQEGKFDECRRIYREEIIPALKNIKGCCSAYLIESLHEKNEAISITIWDDRNAAEEYEKSGMFREMVDKVKHTFSGLYQWKMQLEKVLEGKVKTSEDVMLGKYSMITGKQFLSGK